MKRLVWLLLFAFGTALAQVSPVDVRLVPEEKCPCCDEAGGCGMPKCGVAPASSQPVLQVSDPILVVRATVNGAKRAAQAEREQFYVQFLARPRAVSVLSVPAILAPAASVPLFREHCCLLI
jgi:hypothetical protein